MNIKNRIVNKDVDNNIEKAMYIKCINNSLFYTKEICSVLQFLFTIRKISIIMNLL